MRVLVPQASDASDLPIDVTIENRGARRFLTGETGYFLDCIVTLTNKDGKQIPYTKHGEYVLSGRRDAGQYGLHTYSSGHSRSWMFNLAEAFELLPDGEYCLTLTVKIVFETKDAKADVPESQKFTDSVKLSVKNLEFVVSSKK